MSHISGTWYCGDVDEAYTLILRKGDDALIGEVTSEEVGMRAYQAHACLIAAAPELLAACERTKEILDAWGPERRGDSLERLHERVCAALAKASPPA